MWSARATTLAAGACAGAGLLRRSLEQRRRWLRREMAPVQSTECKLSSKSKTFLVAAVKDRTAIKQQAAV